MLTTLGTQHRRRRGLISAFALFVVAGLQLAALPPQLFAASFDGCYMACGVEGRTCCCKGSSDGEHVEPHAPEAEADGRLAEFEPLCRDLCATFAQAPGGDVWLLAAAHHALARPVELAPIAPSLASFRRLEHRDPSTLPRPPPTPAVLF